MLFLPYLMDSQVLVVLQVCHPLSMFRWGIERVMLGAGDYGKLLPGMSVCVCVCVAGEHDRRGWDTRREEKHSRRSKRNAKRSNKANTEITFPCGGGMGKVLTVTDMFTISILFWHIRILTMQPQHTVPDMFVWLLSNNKRIAYARVRTRDLLYSNNQEARGMLCGKIVTLYLKVRTHSIQLLYSALWLVEKKKLCVYMCDCMCAASRKTACSIINSSQAGCVSVVWNLLRLQPYAGWPACRIQTRNRASWCQQPSFIPALHR